MFNSCFDFFARAKKQCGASLRRTLVLLPQFETFILAAGSTLIIAKLGLTFAIDLIKKFAIFVYKYLYLLTSCVNTNDSGHFKQHYFKHEN